MSEHYARVFAWFCSQTAERSLAADLTQDAFTAYWESLARTTPRRPVVWLFRIARNVWRAALRDKARTLRLVPRTAGRYQPSSPPLADLPPRTEPERLSLTVPDAGTLTESRERAEQLIRLVRELPAPLRETLVLHYWSDLPFDEIARIQGVPALLARWRAHRARDLLRQRWLALDSRPEGRS